MLIHQLRTNISIVIDFQEKSPASIPIQKYQDNPKIAFWGKRSVGVPGFIAGLYHAQQKYGSNKLGTMTLLCSISCQILFACVFLLKV